jgi:UDP:flavonoid glycosyltransferase YjiC (YdhE family)
MLALQDREDIIAVAILGEKDSKSFQDDFPPGTTISANAHVIDFFPFNDILAYSDLFITNGGYGGFQHAVGNSALLIVAGTGADKPEVAMRVEWTGLGVNVRTNMPMVEALRAAVDKVIGNESMGSKRERWRQRWRNGIRLELS